MKEYIIPDDFLDYETKASADGQGYLRELVRCVECYYKDEKRIMDEDALWCRKHHMYVTADWFCADGERKENDDSV